MYLPLTDDFGIGEGLQRVRRVRPCRLKSASMPPTPHRYQNLRALASTPKLKLHKSMGSNSIDFIQKTG